MSEKKLEDRLTEVELAMRELSTIKKLVAAMLATLIATGLPAAGAFVYNTIALEARVAYLEESRREEAVLARGARDDLATLTTDVRVLASTTSTTQASNGTKVDELRTRLERLEAENREERRR